MEWFKISEVDIPRDVDVILRSDNEFGAGYDYKVIDSSTNASLIYGVGELNEAPIVDGFIEWGRL